MKRILESILGLFSHNWGLKLLALTLAIVIYHALKPTSAHSLTNHDQPIFQSH